MNHTETVKYGSVVKFDDVAGKPLGECFDLVAGRVPDKAAIKEDENSITYKELKARTDAFAAGLASIGLGKGDRVAVMNSNSIDTMTAYLGIAKMGGVTVGVNIRYRESELKFMLENSGASAIVCPYRDGNYEFIPLLKEIRKDSTQFKHIITLGPAEDSQQDTIVFNELIEKHTGDKYPDPKLDSKKDLLILLYTSGTTGVPKGVPITHYRATRNTAHGVESLEVTADDVILSQLPWFHVFSLTLCIDIVFLSGATMVTQDPYSPIGTLTAIEKHGVTVHNGTPTMYLMEMNNKDFKKFDISSLRIGAAAGASFSAALFHRIFDEMKFDITSYYGMTELCGIGLHCSLSDSIEMKTQTIGLPIKDCKVKACDEEGREVPLGEVGEMWFRGWTILTEYWNNEAETKKTITDDGWLKTGDLVRILDNGYVQIVGRKKDQLNRGGYKVYPTELEEILIRHPKVAEVTIVGIPNEVLGELICACVIPREGVTDLTLTELREFCKDRLADYKMPDELSIMPDFPRMASGKINKFGKGGVQDLARADDNRQKLQRGRK